MYAVREFVEKVFSYLNLDWERHIEVDPRYFRPTEVDILQGNAGKARKELGWEPHVMIDELVRRMVEHDLKLADQERTLTDAGHVFWPRGVASQ
jgi:GDPmannose 4,6-dehydratase